MADDDNGKIVIAKDRSPAFPYIALDVAIDRVKRIYQGVRDHAQSREAMAQAYGKPATSSGTLQTFATLLQYGLLENVHSPAGRKMRVSALAQEILNPHAPKEKVQSALQKAALRPTIFNELWKLYGDMEGLGDTAPLYYLTKERTEEGNRGDLH